LNDEQIPKKRGKLPWQKAKTKCYPGLVKLSCICCVEIVTGHGETFGILHS